MAIEVGSGRPEYGAFLPIVPCQFSRTLGIGSRSALDQFNRILRGQLAPAEDTPQPMRLML